MLPMKSPFFWSATSVSRRLHSAITEFPNAVKKASSCCFVKMRVCSFDHVKFALNQRERDASHNGTNNNCRTPGKWRSSTLASEAARVCFFSRFADIAPGLSFRDSFLLSSSEEDTPEGFKV